MHKFGYHFAKGGKLRYDGRRIKVGVTHQAMVANNRGKRLAEANEVNICCVGLHASPTPHQAYDYVSGDTLSHVLVHGIPEEAVQEDKFAGLYRTYLRVVRISESDQAELADLFYNSKTNKFNAKCKKLLNQPDQGA